MRVVITGARGMLGAKLSAALAARGSIAGSAIDELALADISTPDSLEAPFDVTRHAVDIRQPRAVAALLAGEEGGKPADVIFHLAALASGGSEADFDTGLAINLQGSINVFEAARSLGTTPRVIFTSTIAVYGGEAPDPITDGAALNPQTSYGAAKAAAEMLLTDYSRRGFLDGRGLRLPTITIRPGKPNTAASSFMSSIFREPLQGEDAVCPVSPDYRHWYQSPRRCIENLIHGAEVAPEALGLNRSFCLPGLSLTIGEMVEALRRVAGDAPVNRIDWKPMPEVQTILDGWRGRFEPTKAERLGFRCDEDFDSVIRYFLADDLAT